jgi:hypothetical protein
MLTIAAIYSVQCNIWSKQVHGRVRENSSASAIYEKIDEEYAYANFEHDDGKTTSEKQSHSPGGYIC